MKLCEALKLAATLPIPKSTGEYYRLDDDGNLCACAMGKALLAAELVTPAEAKRFAQIKRGYFAAARVPSEWRRAVKVPEPILDRIWKSKPEWASLLGSTERLGTLTACMNDSGQFSEKEIADIVCELEPA